MSTVSRSIWRRPCHLAAPVLFLLSFCCPLLPALAAEQPPPITHGGYALAQNDKLLAARSPDTPLVPASIWKIATALHAMERLGSDYRFATLCYYGPDQTLYVKGTGDPMLVSEEVALLAGRLYDAGVRQVTAIVLDDSAFALDGAAADGASDTLNPYDVWNSALAVNFNTIHVIKDAAGQIRSAEPQTPFLPIMSRLGKGLPSGTHRINISQNRKQIWQYAGELLANSLSAKGIAVSGQVRSGTVPDGLPLRYRHLSSKSLPETLAAMLEFSNNFIANQIFLACGAQQFGYPANWKKGKMAMEEFLRQRTKLPPHTFVVEEGSGLSRKNRITPRAMLTVLDAFRPYAGLLPSSRGVLVKSGTLHGVYSYAGYFKNSQGLDPFVLILNQPENGRDRLLRYLERLHQGR